MKFDPDWVVAPGETLVDWFEEQGARWDSEIALRLAAAHGISGSELGNIVRGGGPGRIGESQAERLESMTGITARFWLALEHNYRVGLDAGKRRV